MKTTLTWKKGLFSNLYSIYSEDELIGKLMDEIFSQTAKGELNGEKYLFKTKGFLKQYTEIINSTDNKVIGKINYNNWMTKATISINDKTIYWKYNNIWNTKWTLFDNEKINIKYTGSSTKGHIETNINDNLLLLTGLFVTNYYWQMTIVIIIAAFIPIWISIIN